MKWVRLGVIELIFKIARELYLSISQAFPNWLAVDTSACKAPLAKESGKSPVDRGKRGFKKNLISDSDGMPLALGVWPGNVHDSKTLEEIILQAKEVLREKLTILAADSAYDSKRLRAIAKANGLVLHAATNRRKNKDCPVVKPKGRWIIERTHSWLNTFRSVKTCFLKSREAFLGFLQLASSSLLLRRVLVFG